MCTKGKLQMMNRDGKSHCELLLFHFLSTVFGRWGRWREENEKVLQEWIKNLFPARRVFGWPVTWAATNQTRDLGFQLMIRWLIVVDDTDQRMRKMKARARQIIPVTFSSLQQRLQKEFVNNLGLGGKGEWWWSGWMPTIYYSTLGKKCQFQWFWIRLGETGTL